MQPKRRGLWLTIIGAIIMLPVAFGIFIGGTVLGVKNMANLVEEAPVVTAGSSHDFAADTTVAMFGDGSGSSCSVTDPSGSAVTLDNSAGGSVQEGDSTFNLLGSFTTTDAGAYTIDCGSGVDVSVLSGKDASAVSQKLLMPILVGFGGAALAGLIGLGLLITGIVKLVRSNRERTAWSQQQAYAGGYGAAPAGYPYGQPQQGYPPQYGQQEYGQQQPPQYGQQSPPDPGQQPPTQQ